MVKGLSAILFAVVVSATLTSFALPSSEEVRQATGKYIREKHQEEGIKSFTNALTTELKSSVSVGDDRLALYGGIADCVRLMQLSKEVPIPENVLEWILTSNERLHLLVETLSSKDKLPECMAILDQLATHDPEGRDPCFKLILAMSVVWDEPRRPRLHRQMGRNVLPYEPELEKRYDYFKNLYESKQAKVAYDDLVVSDLIFVVDTPVPVEELEWARENEGGSVNSWGKKYAMIEYDNARLQKEKFDWPNGDYRLSSIKELGGICVDQAYYCVITARAHGIPSIFFDAIGSSGGHAWFSYMRSPGKWELDIGRYENQNYTTGNAFNPQTGRSMTDHDIEFAIDSTRRTSAAVKAEGYITIANVLHRQSPTIARRCAREARKAFPKNLDAWNLELGLLIEERDYSGMLSLFKEFKDVFRKYPDVLTDAASKINSALVESGRDKDAETLFKMLSGVIDSDRDDIEREMEMMRITQMMESGDSKTALREFEQLLDDQMEEGSKMLPLLNSYFEFMVSSGQVHEGVDFLGDYIEDIVEKSDMLPVYERQFFLILRDAYREVDDQEALDEVETRLQEYD
ncbi:MAG: hypothetical protein JXR23_01920 [Pontiellaceae bacterium]|nr:hypothetical protein [Pontiellaceae bacterium]